MSAPLPAFGQCAFCGEAAGVILPDDDRTQVCGPCWRKLKPCAQRAASEKDNFSALQKGEGRKNVTQASEPTRAPLANGASSHNSQRRHPPDAVELAPIAGAAGARRMPH